MFRFQLISLDVKKYTVIKQKRSRLALIYSFNSRFQEDLVKFPPYFVMALKIPTWRPKRSGDYFIARSFCKFKSLRLIRLETQFAQFTSWEDQFIQEEIKARKEFIQVWSFDNSCPQVCTCINTVQYPMFSVNPRIRQRKQITAT